MPYRIHTDPYRSGSMRPVVGSTGHLTTDSYRSSSIRTVDGTGTGGLTYDYDTACEHYDLGFRPSVDVEALPERLDGRLTRLPENHARGRSRDQTHVLDLDQGYGHWYEYGSGNVYSSGDSRGNGHRARDYNHGDSWQQKGGGDPWSRGGSTGY
ncbi:Uu.00g114450.m01.CDS01 [Anthostomella pinea]|uniref:Uu.00g114450.m01.CDS01 n=1 Tax=Anthostomella pinea TaxID=933095 RepID=A0AAI8YGN4_9PEZI|nr:Uu.00g114450.m01.CDS01 [Anthostomella pinea]